MHCSRVVRGNWVIGAIGYLLFSVLLKHSTGCSVETEFFYYLLKLSFNHKKSNLKAPGDLYCWDI